MPASTKTVKASKRPGRKTTQSKRSQSPPKLRGVDVGWRQFLMDLHDLLLDHEGKWVVYHRTKRFEFGETRYELFQKCYARGWKHDEFYIGLVEPLDPTINVDEALNIVET